MCLERVGNLIMAATERLWVEGVRLWGLRRGDSKEMKVLGRGCPEAEAPHVILDFYGKKRKK